MRAIAVAIAGTFPYGSAELKRYAQTYLQRAALIAVAVHIAAIGGVKLGGIIAAHRESDVPHISRISVIPMPPPPLSTTPPAAIPVAPQAVAPTVGVPEPVPDAQAPKELTMATQEEIQTFNPAAEEGLGGSGEIIIAAREEERLPIPGEFVFYEEDAVNVFMPTPKYTDIARDAQVEGTVVVWALIGKDGTVERVQINKSVAMLDDSALDAVKRSKWKPAINNGKPARQWVAVPIRYTLN